MATWSNNGLSLNGHDLWAVAAQQGHVRALRAEGGGPEAAVTALPVDPVAPAVAARAAQHQGLVERSRDDGKRALGAARYADVDEVLAEDGRVEQLRASRGQQRPFLPRVQADQPDRVAAAPGNGEDDPSLGEARMANGGWRVDSRDPLDVARMQHVRDPPRHQHGAPVAAAQVSEPVARDREGLRVRGGERGQDVPLEPVQDLDLVAADDRGQRAAECRVAPRQPVGLAAGAKDAGPVA